MRALAAVLVFVALACGSSSSLGVGEPCSASSECGDGLLCDFGMTPPTCQGQGTPVPDASLLDAQLTIDGPNPVIDGPLPVIDAPLPDARLPDAQLPDADPTDAML